MLIAFVRELDIRDADHRQAYRTIARWCCRLTKTMRGLVEDSIGVSAKTRTALKEFRHWADNSSYWEDLWRVMVKGRRPKKWGIDPKDVSWIYTYLSLKDKRTLKHIQRYKIIPTKRFGPKTMRAITTELERFCRSVVRRRLCFIYKYDQGVAVEDLVNELVEVALKTIRKVEYEGNRLKAMNFARRAARNRAINIINFHTAEKRSRLIELENSSQEYQVKVVANDNLTHTRIAERSTEEVIERVSCRLGPVHEHYARCVLGVLPGFDEWVKMWHGRDVSSMPVEEVGRIAENWVDIGHDQLMENLAAMFIR